MEAGEAKIHKVLDGTKQFLVPHYQRPYSWGERDWEVLWRDIIELAADDGAQPHFMGSIVTAPGRAVPEGVEKRLLIDGQQRLTTLVVLLALIRQRAIAADATKLANRIAGLLMNRDEEGSLDFYKLLPTQGDSAAASDREALLALLDRREPATMSRIVEASRFFATKLARPDTPDLDRLFSTITGRLTLVSIILDKHDNPYRIFESLNGKGLPLTQVDLIRNYFFMRLPEGDHERIYRAKWQPMQQRLGEEGLTEFVRHYLMMAGQLVKESDVYATLKERADGGDPRQHLDDLVAFAGHYAVLLDPARAATPALQQRLARLKRLDVTVAYPFLLPAYADIARGALTTDQLVATLDTVETYLVRRFVCGVATHGLNKVFTPLYQQVKQEADFVEGTKTLLAARACPRDDEFRDRLESARLYGSGERRTKTAFILGRLEAALGHRELVDVASMQVEHVMPQTLTEWWRAHLGDDWEDAHSQLLHTLGNLTLTNYNQELSNRPFGDKRTAFLDSHVGLNAYFRDLDHWNEGEITRRGEALAELALGVWPYFGPARVEPAVRTPRERAQGDDVTSTLPQSLTFRGARVSVRSWREVLTKTFELVLAAEPDAFGTVLEELTGIVGMDPSAFRRSRRCAPISSARSGRHWSGIPTRRRSSRRSGSVGRSRSPTARPGTAESYGSPRPRSPSSRPLHRASRPHEDCGSIAVAACAPRCKGANIGGRRRRWYSAPGQELVIELPRGFIARLDILAEYASYRYSRAGLHRCALMAARDRNAAMTDFVRNASELILYQTEDGRTRIECRLEGETLWLTQGQMAELFQTTPQNITQHLKELYAEGELDEAATCKAYLQARLEGLGEVKRSLRHYNLDAILAIGFRVRSHRGTQFRQWATAHLSEYLVKGFTMDDERLKNPPGPGHHDYFDELIERIREIRASERRFYLKVLDIYATSVDYKPDVELSQRFFAAVQI